MANYRYLAIGFRPAPLDVVLDPNSDYSQGCQRELALVDAAPHLLETIRTAQAWLRHASQAAQAHGLVHENYDIVVRQIQQVIDSCAK